MPISMFEMYVMSPPRGPPCRVTTAVANPCSMSDQSPRIACTPSRGARSGCHAVPDASRANG